MCVWENDGPLLNKAGPLVTQDIEKAEVPKATFTSVFVSKSNLQEPHDPETKGKIWSKKDAPLVGEDQVREYLVKPGLHKSMGPEGMHPHMLREQADAIMRPLLIIFG